MFSLEPEFEITAGSYIICVEARPNHFSCPACNRLSHFSVPAWLRVGLHKDYTFKLGLVSGVRCPNTIGDRTCGYRNLETPIPFPSKERAQLSAMRLARRLTVGPPKRLRLIGLGVINTTSGMVT